MRESERQREGEERETARETLTETETSSLYAHRDLGHPGAKFRCEKMAFEEKV